MHAISQEECVIERVIVHVLDNTKSEPDLTDIEVILPPEYESFLRSHIATCLRNSIACVFDDRANNSVYLKSEAAVSNPDTYFVTGSQELTRDLFGRMSKQTINGGTLWAVLFRKRNESATHLALLKMDDKASLTWKQEQAEDGKRLLRLEGNDHTLPQEEVRLDKAAFIFLPSIPDGELLFEYDLRVVDRKRRGHQIADFFSDFLGCSTAFQAKRSTQKFINTIDKFVQDRGDALRADNLAQDIQFTKTMYLRNHDEIDIEEYTNAAFGDRVPILREQLAQALGVALHANRFHVDPEMKRKLNSRTVWKLIKGTSRLELRGEAVAFDEMVDASAMGSDGIITIRVSNFTTA